MLYDVLGSFREFLETKYAAETARTYSTRLEYLLQGQNLTLNAENLDIQKVINNLAQIKYKSYFSNSKNAFLHFCTFLEYTLDDETLEQIKTLEVSTRKKYRKMKAVYLTDINKRIKGLRNKKLKLSYQVILATGLRVAEFAQITKADCLWTENDIEFSFIAKGGKVGAVRLTKEENPKLHKELINIITTAKPSQKIFYSAIYLQTNAKKLGFTCHDLRRLFAKLEYKKSQSKNEVRNKLRHSSMKNTNLYLKSKVKIK